MNPQHTPGPWTLTKNISRIEVRTDPMRSYAFSHSDAANACLISAAPDLLEALEEIVNNCSTAPESRAKARAAIAKARGGAL